MKTKKQKKRFPFLLPQMGHIAAKEKPKIKTRENLIYMYLKKLERINLLFNFGIKCNVDVIHLTRLMLKSKNIKYGFLSFSCQFLLIN